MLNKNNGVNVSDEVMKINNEVKIDKKSAYDKLKERKKEVFYYVIDEDSDDPINIEYHKLSKAQLEALDEKYSLMKKDKPEKVIINKRVIDPPEDHENYIKWKKDNQEIDNTRLAETLILALVEKPEGETLTEQIQFLKDILGGGHFDSLIIEIMKSSGYKFDKEIEKAKND